MTEREAAIRRAISIVEDAFPSGGGGWAKRRHEAWVQAVIDLDPDAVDQAARALVRDWADDHGRPPQAGHLRQRAIETARSRPANDEEKVTFVEAAPDHRDPPGTVRWVVIRPDGTRFPRGARIAGDV